MRSSKLFEKRGIDRNEILWRYMDFTKFVDLILSQGIYLRRSDLFEDPYEGHLSKFHIDDISCRYNEIKKNINTAEFFLKGVEQEKDNQINATKQIKFFSYVSCWHRNEYESAAMWSLYASMKDSIAIKTTVGGLCDAINYDVDDYQNDIIYFDGVSYFDYHKSNDFEGSRNSWLNPLFIKRKSFEHEKEFRVLLLKSDALRLLAGPDRDEIRKSDSKLKDINKTGLKLKINIEALVSEIYISPTASEAFLNLVKKFLDMAGFSNIKCTKSDLYTLK